MKPVTKIIIFIIIAVVAVILFYSINNRGSKVPDIEKTIIKKIRDTNREARDLYGEQKVITPQKTKNAPPAKEETNPSPTTDEHQHAPEETAYESPQQTEQATENKETNPTETIPEQSTYPWHSDITATVFWVGEPVGKGSSEDNALSCWDDQWMEHYGGYDDPNCRNGYYPCNFTPKDQNFYVSVPYDDFDNGERRANAFNAVPWSRNEDWTGKSMIKGRWVEIEHEDNTCYAQVNDCGPYVYDDWEYVFGENGKESSPKNTRANSAGMDVSPALRDCLNFEGLNNADNKINWRFIQVNDVPEGPWKEFITNAAISW